MTLPADVLLFIGLPRVLVVVVKDFRNTAAGADFLFPRVPAFIAFACYHLRSIAHCATVGKWTSHQNNRDITVMIKRYDDWQHRDWEGDPNTIEPCEEGRFVRFQDYQKLADFPVEDRIKLAEARGWTRHEYGPDDRLAKLPEGNSSGGTFWLRHGDEYLLKDLPDPEHDANDCEALIKHLNCRGWDVDIWWSGNSEPRCNVACRVKARFRDGSKERYDIPCDNWKQGVCELALKVIGNA